MVSMQIAVVEATEEALRAVREPRFFRSERGFQGRFYCALQEALDHRRLLDEPRVLEIEYQKSTKHRTTQRPDVILHVPAEEQGASVAENNFAVWALKRRASRSAARGDFQKLDEMIDRLGYEFGVFVNIDSGEHRKEAYCGNHSDRISAVAARLVDGDVFTVWSESPAWR